MSEVNQNQGAESTIYILISLLETLTCAAIAHAGQLVVPYGFSDAGVVIARLPLSRLLEALLSERS